MALKLIPAAHELISDMRAFFQTNNSKLNYLNEEPLRAELFSSDQLDRFGKALAKGHKLSTQAAKEHLLKRLADNETILNEVRKLLTDSIRKKYQITPAGEWLIDNFYLIEEHIRNAKVNFPKGYSKDLPQLSEEGSPGLTRIYDIVLQIISHSDGRIDMESLSRFIKSYQSVTNLQLGELWAIPIMLRLALIENLRRVSSRIAIDRVDANLADYWAKKMIETAEKTPKDQILVIADMARSDPPMVSAFVSELIRQLQGKGPDLALVLNWIEQQLADSGTTSIHLVNAENQKKAADQVSMSNSIGSLRLLGAMDWRDFVESHSIVEHTLREDERGIYGLMDFATRDRYRHVVEQIAKKSKLNENQIAHIAINLAHDKQGRNTNDENRKAHVGYYLIGPGVNQTKALAKLTASILQKTRQYIYRHRLKVYLASIFLITIVTSFYILLGTQVETRNNWLLIIIAFLSLLSASQLAISFVNFFSTILVKPDLLPRMDFSKGIPPDFRTMVVIPVMLTNTDEIENLIEALEVRFLANINEYLQFALLTDFTDAAQEKLPGDDVLISLARQRIEDLNVKYNREKNDLFYLFHRPRHWNQQENTWMGYERKRGKISELNALLRGGARDRFSLIVGDQSIFPFIKYVITLDADTQLPMGSAWKLIGTMAHPLNHALYNESKKRVTEGYGILQPRVNNSLPEETGSLYTRMHGNEPGIDPYTRASSDVYQDIFEEGSFIGKGIYDIDIFKEVLDGKFAENCILSHDLLEGCYVRSGLVSDVQLFEKYPGTYRADIKRRSRWVRGDWQIFSWWLPIIPSGQKGWTKNPLSGLSRWKIFDNIRRSLVPIALTTLLLFAWIVLDSSLFWTIVVSAIIVGTIIITSLWDAFNKPKDVILKHHIKNSIRSITDIFTETLFTLICLPYEAYINFKSIVRSLWRILVTRKQMLEWNPFAHEKNVTKPGLLASYSDMWIEVALPVFLLIYLGINAPMKLFIAGPILFLWLIAPFVTWWISQPLPKQVAVLTPQQNIFLLKLARKTWNFFERFVGPEDHWLPPDNFQEQPIAMIAHRTSPTNIGISLLANLAACDFGYITTGQFIERTEKTITTLMKLERFKGHFFNWYDTQTLNPLLPKYISTVDSGNLAAHLLVLRQGLSVILHQKINGLKTFKGMRDTLGILLETLNEKDTALMQPLQSDIESVIHHSIPPHEIGWHIDTLYKKYTYAIDQITSTPESETARWMKILKDQLHGGSEEFKMFYPWYLLSSAPELFSDFKSVDIPGTLDEILKTAKEFQTAAQPGSSSNYNPESHDWYSSFQTALEETLLIVNERLSSIEFLTLQCNKMSDMEWDFLYDRTSHLFTIGYNVLEHRIDSSYYDLLASEARLAVFIGIAQGKLPEESWFALGRLLTNVEGNSILLSWSGSMFEYLMPLLVMPSYENTLLDQTCKAAVKWQIEYGDHIGLPWGISESGYNRVNAHSHYQYRAFGAPGMGLKRGLEEDSVIAPYASALALMIAPEKACKNLEVLYEKGFAGRYGFYEAIDYTSSRLPRGHSNAIVYSFMTHHQGMSLLSLAYLLLNKPMQKLFESEPRFKATLLLLQERIPKASTFFTHTTSIADVEYIAGGTEIRILKTANTPIPEVQLLSNGRYHVMLSNSGSGYSRWKDLSVTRWREDGTCDHWGTFCYIRDLESNTYWSNTHQPTLKRTEKYEVSFSQGRVDFHNLNDGIETHTEIVVSPEDDIEMRRILIKNNSDNQRTIDITSYAEVVLASSASDLMQPAFSNLFVQTRILPKKFAIICTRRPRSAEEQAPWMFHLMTMHGKVTHEVSYETDRMEFIGRGNSIVNPRAMKRQGPLSGKEGSVLNPIVAIRYKILLDPDEKVTLDMITGIAESNLACESLINKYQDKHHKDRVFEMAWTHSQVVLRQINSSESDAQLYGRLASSILFTNATYRADPSILINNHRGQSGLWGYAISGDVPIVLLKIENQINMLLVKQLVQAHAYWRLKGLAVDLVIWNEEHNVYRQGFQTDIQALVPAELRDRPGGIFVRASDQISNEDRILFQTVARINISDSKTLENFVKLKSISKPAIPLIVPSKKVNLEPSYLPVPKDLIFFNGSGGFSPDGSEYVIIIDNKNQTPTPWVNVIANPVFGTIISESGTAYTWTENAHELRLTPWNNDPVSDPGGEAFYLRDEESGHFWSTTYLPSRNQSNYITRHGFGYSVFEHIESGIYTEMTVYVDLEASLKFNVIKIRNQSGRSRRLSVTGYTEWVLGDSRVKTAMHIHTEIDPDSGVFFARNQYSTEFSGRVAFFDTDESKNTFTADRTEFIGRNGTLQTPDAMSRSNLSGKIGLALDPCAAIQVPFNLGDGEEREIIFRLGAGRDATDASMIARKFRGNANAHDALEKVKTYWKQIVGALQIETPDTAINILTNGWLTYQTLSSRLWGRSGFYQSGGAFGFRDQLQDVMSMIQASPVIAKDQILLCASRQFREGDVQHWWHPPSGRGVRTRCSDDFLWLPLVTATYILKTGDQSILDERIHYLEGRQLNSDEESYYDLPIQSVISASLYDHCVQAIRHGFNYGERGIPLIGSGDWNDGYDKVGIKGKGESVWMAFFLYDILIRFEAIAMMHNDSAFAGECKKEASHLKTNIDTYAWDGAWYKRAWFDDGAELGTSANEECKIDSIAQSWSVLSGAGDEQYIHIAMDSAYKHLVKKDVGIIQLLEPPFDKSALNPGYIKGYVPGVRENGGQYTHAAIWMIMAFAKLGDNKRVWELLNMINPINHGKDSKTISIYKVEPYVIAADVYAGTQHAGRGGWTWYTGSAGWMYRLITEYFLGIQQEGNKLKIAPCIPPEWDSFKVRYQFNHAVYHLVVTQKEGTGELTVMVDGVLQEDSMITLSDDEVMHDVQIFIHKKHGVLKHQPRSVDEYNNTNQL